MKRLLAAILALCALAGFLCCAGEETDYKAEYEHLLEENALLKAEIERYRELLEQLESGAGLEEELSRIRLEAAAADPSVIAVFKGGTVSFSEVYKAYEEVMGYYAEMFEAFGMEPDFTQEDIYQMQKELTGELADAKIIDHYLEQNGITLLSEAEISEITAQAEAEYNEMYDSALNYFISDGLDRETAEEYVIEYFKDYMIDPDTMVSDRLSEARTEALTQLLAGEVTVTEDEIDLAYRELLQSDREYYTQYPEDFAFDVLHSESAIAFVPEGYRRVRMVIVPFGEDAMSAYDELYGDGLTDSPEADALFEALLPEAEAVYERLKDGERFDAIRAEYPDTEMYMDELGGDTGFYLSADCEMFDTVTDAAIMALGAVGEVTEPQKCDWGWAIFEYAQEMESGDVPLEVIRDRIALSVYNTKRSDQYDAALQNLREEAGLTFYFDRLN